MRSSFYFICVINFWIDLINYIQGNITQFRIVGDFFFVIKGNFMTVIAQTANDRFQFCETPSLTCCFSLFFSVNALQSSFLLITITCFYLNLQFLAFLWLARIATRTKFRFFFLFFFKFEFYIVFLLASFACFFYISSSFSLSFPQFFFLFLSLSVIWLRSLLTNVQKLHHFYSFFL